MVYAVDMELNPQHSNYAPTRGAQMKQRGKECAPSMEQLANVAVLKAVKLRHDREDCAKNTEVEIVQYAVVMGVRSLLFREEYVGNMGPINWYRKRRVGVTKAS